MPASINARTATAAAPATIASEAAIASAACGLCRQSGQRRAGFGGLRDRNHLRRLLQRRDLGPDDQPGLGGEKALPQQRPTRLRDRLKERLRPAVLDEQQSERRPRQTGTLPAPTRHP